MSVMRTGKVLQQMKIPDIDPRDMEKYSSAITLSDMEVFVFPELMYSLVLANIMSPILWQHQTRKQVRAVKCDSYFTANRPAQPMTSH